MQNRPIGPIVENWTLPPRPTGEVLKGRYTQLEPLAPDHAAELYAAYIGEDWVWDYMPNGPYTDVAGYADWVQQVTAGPDCHYTIRDLETGALGGTAALLRIDPAAGSIEVGYIAFAPHIQRTRGATEAMYLMMKWAFEAGYRRYEWKCNALNLPSRRAAERLGFSYEGIFRQATVVKTRNRDTAWFAAIDGEWPALKAAFETWLAPENFENGAQKQSLSALTAPVLVMRDPELA